jgi:hypothetical protein
MLLKSLLYQVTHWETWDWRIKYIPLIPSWIWFSVRSRSVWFFTPSNPGLIFGGFDGVSKKDMYQKLPPGSYPSSRYISAGSHFSQLKQTVLDAGFQYPLVVKPEIGRMGLMFRKINNEDELENYHRSMTANYILQEFVDYPIEVSVFYYRYPGERSGTITGFLKKQYMGVTGNGSSTLLELIARHPSASLRMGELRSKHADRLGEIIPAGQYYCLSHALNLSRGGKLVNIEHEKDERLLNVFDRLSHYSNELNYGRYDIKCASVEDLKKGENFKILEYNGSGGEPHHVYGNGNSLLKACRILHDHWEVMYRISKQNNALGTPYWKFSDGLKFFMSSVQHVKQLRRLDMKLSAS